MLSHNTLDKTYSCRTCNHSFPRPGLLRKHMESHYSPQSVRPIPTVSANTALQQTPSLPSKMLLPPSSVTNDIPLTLLGSIGSLPLSRSDSPLNTCNADESTPPSLSSNLDNARTADSQVLMSSGAPEIPGIVLCSLSLHLQSQQSPLPSMHPSLKALLRFFNSADVFASQSG